MDQVLYPRTDPAAVAAAPGKPAASWAAIVAGAFVAAGVSLILLALGAGLGFASVSPWAEQGMSATSFTVTTAIWLIVTQWISACFGGYIAGRLRTRWIGTHTHEIFFRDTAHGLVTWAVATVLVAALIGSSLVSLVGGSVRTLSGAASASASGASSTSGSSAASYETDKLFRSANVMDGDPRAQDSRLQAAHIMANAITTGSVADADRAYLSNVVAAQTGVSPSDAQRRVDDWVSSGMQAETKLKIAADAARKAAAKAAIYTALSLLIGAFIASVSAALGGRLRDEHP